MSLDKVISIARSQLGTVEDPPGSNNVIYNTDYYGHPVSGSGYPWCAVFLWDIFRMAGESNAFYGGRKTASCTSLMEYYSGQNRWFTSGMAQVGDIAIISFDASGKIEHCGLIVGTTSDSYYTIEGNTSPGLEGSQANGGCVAYKERSLSNIVGCCRVIYSDQTDDGGPIADVSSDTAYQSFNRTNQNLFQLSNYSSELINLTEVRDFIGRVEGRDIDSPDHGTSLLSYPSLVEAPYINVNIGGFTFGKYNETRTQDAVIINYPNFVTSLDVTKINGQVNMYTITMLYQIRVGDDPNFIDKILSSVGYGKIKISYGDYASPSFVYKEEEAIITKVTSKVNFGTSSIQYIISCTSSALQLLGTNYSYEYHAKSKPSSIIRSMLDRANFYRLTNIFPALTGDNLNKNFSRFIATDDAAVEIPAKEYMDPVSYINFLVTYMVPESDNPTTTQRSATYFMTIHDDSYADYSDVGGTYFKITKIPTTYKTVPTFNTYTVDIGYPGGNNPGENLVMDFNLTDDNSWALLYDYSQSDMGASQQNYSYSINDYGQAIQHYSPNVTINALKGKTTAAMQSWWTRMTEFPISATLVIKGLIRSAMLMSYIRVNSFFYGKKHVSSGLYIVTKQQDKVDGSGYRTILSLTRIAGADEYIIRKKTNRQVRVITNIQPDNTERVSKFNIEDNYIPIEEETLSIVEESSRESEGRYGKGEPLIRVPSVREQYIIPADAPLVIIVSDFEGMTLSDGTGVPFSNPQYFPYTKAFPPQLLNSPENNSEYAKQNDDWWQDNRRYHLQRQDTLEYEVVADGAHTNDEITADGIKVSYINSTGDTTELVMFTIAGQVFFTYPDRCVKVESSNVNNPPGYAPTSRWR